MWMARQQAAATQGASKLAHSKEKIGDRHQLRFQKHRSLAALNTAIGACHRFYSDALL